MTVNFNDVFSQSFYKDLTFCADTLRPSLLMYKDEKPTTHLKAIFDPFAGTLTFPDVASDGPPKQKISDYSRHIAEHNENYGEIHFDDPPPLSLCPAKERKLHLPAHQRVTGAIAQPQGKMSTFLPWSMDVVLENQRAIAKTNLYADFFDYLESRGLHKDT